MCDFFFAFEVKKSQHVSELLAIVPRDTGNAIAC